MSSRDGRAWTSAGAALLAALVTLGCGRAADRYGSDGLKRLEGRIAASGVRTGTWRSWYPSGERREEGRYEDGRRVGTWTQWYPSGQLRSRGERVPVAETGASEREGAWTFWHENGVVAAVGTFARGRREGRWEYSHGDGRLDGLRSGEYHDDAPLD